MAAYKYGMNTESNVLQILPNSNLLYGAIALVTVQLCLSHAVGSSALFQNCEEYLNIPKRNIHPIHVAFSSNTQQTNQYFYSQLLRFQLEAMHSSVADSCDGRNHS